MTEKNKTVGIGEVVKRCQVSEKQLRYWQNQGYITPENVPCGDRMYRHYSVTDVQLIAEIKSLLYEGYTLKMAVEKAKNNGILHLPVDTYSTFKNI